MTVAVHRPTHINLPPTPLKISRTTSITSNSSRNTEPPSPATPPPTFPYLPSFPVEPWQARIASGVTRAKSRERLRTFASISSDGSDSEEIETEDERLKMSTGNLKRKVVIMGSPSVGKTSLTQQYVAPPTYNEQYFPTIEATSHKNVSFDGIDYECEIIDSAGQDEYTLFQSKYAVGVHGYMLVYSINSRQSFEMIQIVHDKILDFAGLEKVPCVIVGQKCDLAASERRVTTAEGEALAKKLHAGFIESSAKDNKNVGKAFEALLKEMQSQYNPPPEKKKSSWWSWGK